MRPVRLKTSRARRVNPDEGLPFESPSPGGQIPTDGVPEGIDRGRFEYRLQPGYSTTSQRGVEQLGSSLGS